jgi:hypothetical protein
MPGFLQRQIIRAIQAGGPLTVADASAMAGPDIDPRNIRRAFKSLYRKGLVNLAVRPVLTARPLGSSKKGKKPIGERIVPAREENGRGGPRHASSEASINPVARPSAPALSPARMANNLSPPSPFPVSPNPPARLIAPLSLRGAAPPQAATRQVSGTSPSPGSGSSPAPRPRPRSSPGKGASPPLASGRAGASHAPSKAAVYPDPGVFANPADAYAEQIRAKVESAKREAIAAVKQTTV